MAGLSQTVERIGGKTYRYAYSGTGPYRIYREGALTEITDAEFVIVEAGDDPEIAPAIEVFDVTHPDDFGPGVPLRPETMTNPPITTLIWRGVIDAVNYTIQKWTGAAYETVGFMPEDGRGYYVWTSVVNDDGEDTRFKVIAVDARGVQSTPSVMRWSTIQNPSVPPYTLTYDSGANTITATARV